MHRLLTLAVLTLRAAACSVNAASVAPVATGPDQQNGKPNAIVEREVDGYTIEIIGNRERESLRRIDTSESVAVNHLEHCYGRVPPRALRRSC